MHRMMTRRMILAGAAAGWAIGSGPGAAGTPVAGVASLLAETGAPGAGMALLREGRVSQAVAGLRAIGDPAPVAAGDLWHLGSNTKAMTATLAARLVEAEVIRWQDTVGDILGPVIAGIDPAYRGATYADLLRHRAGLPSNIGLLASLGLQGLRADRDMLGDRATYARAVLTTAPEAAPGTEHYANAGYVVAGQMLQVATGQPWEELIKAHVFGPLGITSAGFGAPGRADVIDQPRGHKTGLFGRLVAMEPGPQADNIPALGPAGTVHITMADMMRFLGVHAARDPAFLAAESWDMLHNPTGGGSYAMGWSLTDTGHLGHNGSNTFWFARMQIAPASGDAVFLAVNSGDAEAIRDPMRRLADAALSA
jgi:D-alanyl-D-alanine carboxypeptidase